MQNVVKELAMAGALRKTMVYLGLAEEDERYDTYDDFDEPSSHHETPARDERAPVMNLPHRTPVARVVRDVEVGALNRIATIHPRTYNAVSYTHLRAHETDSYLVCRLLLEKKKKKQYPKQSRVFTHTT